MELFAVLSVYGLGIFLFWGFWSLVDSAKRNNELLEQINTKLFRLQEHFTPHFERKDDVDD